MRLKVCNDSQRLERNPLVRSPACRAEEPGDCAIPLASCAGLCVNASSQEKNNSSCPMRMINSTRALLIVVIAAVLLVLAPPGVVWSAAPKVKRPKAGGQAKQWLMISLCRNGCSRGCRKLFRVVQQISGNPNGWIFHYSDVTLELVDSLDPEFIILGPQGTPWCRYRGKRGVALQNFLWSLPMIVEKMNVPVLGVCGGHQAMALAFGGTSRTAPGRPG